MVQGGDYQNGDGTGGEAYEGGTLQDECFDMKHDGPFILSMANRGKNTAGSQFFITLGKASHLDGKHVAFGRVIEGQDAIKEMGEVETDERDKPVNLQKIKILDAGIGDGKIDSDTEESSSEDDRVSKKRSSKEKKRSKSDRKHDKKSKKKRRKHDDDRKRKKRKKYSDDESSDDEDSHREKKRRKKHKKSKHRRRREDDDDSSSSSDESSDSHRRKSKKSKKKRKKDSKSKSEQSSHNDQMGGFGKYGIIKESDLRTSTKVKRNFEIWMEEVKGIPQGTNVPKWEMTECFKEYAEDYNTATLPHMKYYDYDKWEMEEYNKKKEESKSKKGAISDEFQFQEERKKKAEEKRRKELDMVRSTMSKEKIEEMKRQSRLKAEMVNAYRVGDEEKRKRLQKRLEPDEK